MPRRCVLAIVLVVLGARGASPAAAQDTASLRKWIGDMLVEEMSKHDTLDTAWHNEKSVDRKKWTSGKLLGRKIRLASWTEQSQSWVWLENPKKTLKLDLTHLAVQNQRIEFAVKMNARARFKAWGRIPKLGESSVGGNLKVTIELAGSVALGARELRDAKITQFQARFDDLNLNNPLANPFENLVKDAMNDYVEDKNEKLRKSMERAINKVHF